MFLNASNFLQGKALFGAGGTLKRKKLLRAELKHAKRERPLNHLRSLGVPRNPRCSVFNKDPVEARAPEAPSFNLLSVGL